MEVFVLLLLVCSSLTDAQDCDRNSIACGNSYKCIELDYICDNDPDCKDASDEEEELCKSWINERCPVKSTLCTRNGEESCVEILEYCTTSNPPCEGDLDKRICSMLESGELTPLSYFDPGANLMRAEKAAVEFRKVVPSTISHDRCPQMYTLLGDTCVSFLFFSSMTWGEAQAFCDLLDGDLMTFHEGANHFAGIIQHMQTVGLDQSFWIGGSLANSSAGWKWIDGSPMVMGTPFWASVQTIDERLAEDRLQYQQRPGELPRGHCASLSSEHFFYITDENCLEKKSPLCVSRTKPTS